MRCAETTNGTSEAELKTAVWPKPSLTTRNKPTKTQGNAVEEEANEDDGSIRFAVRKWVSE